MQVTEGVRVVGHGSVAGVVAELEGVVLETRRQRGSERGEATLQRLHEVRLDDQRVEALVDAGPTSLLVLLLEAVQESLGALGRCRAHVEGSVAADERVAAERALRRPTVAKPTRRAAADGVADDRVVEVVRLAPVPIGLCGLDGDGRVVF